MTQLEGTGADRDEVGDEPDNDAESIGAKGSGELTDPSGTFC